MIPENIILQAIHTPLPQFLKETVLWWSILPCLLTIALMLSLKFGNNSKSWKYSITAGVASGIICGIALASVNVYTTNAMEAQLAGLLSNVTEGKATITAIEPGGGFNTVNFSFAKNTGETVLNTSVTVQRTAQIDKDKIPVLNALFESHGIALAANH